MATEFLHGDLALGSLGSFGHVTTRKNCTTKIYLNGPGHIVYRYESEALSARTGSSPKNQRTLGHC